MVKYLRYAQFYRTVLYIIIVLYFLLIILYVYVLYIVCYWWEERNRISDLPIPREVTCRYTSGRGGGSLDCCFFLKFPNKTTVVGVAIVRWQSYRGNDTMTLYIHLYIPRDRNERRVERDDSSLFGRPTPSATVFDMPKTAATVRM